MEDLVLERLTAWGLSEDGMPGMVATRYSHEIEVSDQPDVANLRLAVRRAFIAGMTYCDAIAAASNRTPTA